MEEMLLIKKGNNHKYISKGERGNYNSDNKKEKEEFKPSNVNDLNPKEWRRYEKDNLQFTTLWDSPERDPYQWSLEAIKGNSPIEIPRQCILRFSKEGETVLDPFVGSGSTLLACARLKRNGVGIEINPKIIKIIKHNLSQHILDPELNEWLKKQRCIQGDSRNIRKLGIKENNIDLIFAHPPYWDLIKYSEEYGYVEGDLSNEKSLKGFLSSLKIIFNECYKVLKPGRFFCILIGEDFKNGGITIPLDYYTTQVALNVGFEYYAKTIKITREATSRRNSMNIMKYRALRSNFFICMHDYVIIFRKPQQ